MKNWKISSSDYLGESRYRVENTEYRSQNSEARRKQGSRIPGVEG